MSSVKVKDLSGQKFFRLTPQDYFTKRNVSGRSQVFWNCLCDCGANVAILGECLRRGTTKSCGCWAKEKLFPAKLHGMSGSDEYKIFAHIKRRCLTVSNPSYKNYGGRGIKICDRWLESFENFYKDMGPRPTPEHSIERKDVNGDYSPENCIWVDDWSLQAFNQRPSKSKTGIPGVTEDSEGYGYLVRICKNYERHYLGFFKSLYEAAVVRKEAELKYYGFNLDWEMPNNER